MTKFNSKKNKLKYVWNLSETVSNLINEEKQIRETNKKNIIDAKQPLSVITKSINYSTEWENFTSINNKTIYVLLEVLILGIPENWIHNLKSEVIFQSTNNNFSLSTNYFYKVKSLQIEDIKNSNDKNLTLKYQVYMSGQTNLFGFQAKLLCHLYPNIKLCL